MEDGLGRQSNIAVRPGLPMPRREVCRTDESRTERVWDSSVEEG